MVDFMSTEIAEFAFRKQFLLWRFRAHPFHYVQMGKIRSIFCSLVLLLIGQATVAQTETALREVSLSNADFAAPHIEIDTGPEPWHTPPERRWRPYAAPDDWEVDGLTRMGHARRAEIGSPQVLDVIDARLSQVTGETVAAATLYTVEVNLRPYGILTSHYTAILEAVDSQSGERIEVLRFGGDSDGGCVGAGKPLLKNDWTTVRAFWFSEWNSQAIGRKLELRVEGRQIEMRAVRILADDSVPLPNSPAWKIDQAELDPSVGGQLTVYSYFFGHDSAIRRPTTGQDREPAYNYSVFPLQRSEGGPLLLFTGGRWRDESRGIDGDHILLHEQVGGPHQPFVMAYDPPRPVTTQGRFEGKGPEYALEHWWTGNMMDPEVVRVNGQWHLFTQVQVNPGNIIDAATGLRAEAPADQIQLHLSDDGRDWRRWSRERGVVTGVDDSTRILMTHHEVIYVPWDKDGRPWWLYVNTFVDYVRGERNPSQFYRFRSDDPTTFDWQQREKVKNFQHLGNQTAYLVGEGGEPFFIRITHRRFKDLERHNLILQYSRDGLQWFTLGGEEDPVQLDSSKDEQRNRSTIFPGIATLDGQGRIESLGDGWFRAIYAATTANGGGQPDIWYSSIGTGWIYFHLEL